MFEINWNSSIPTTEFSPEFVQGMADRMATSYCKYGAVKDAYPHRVDALKSMIQRLAKYEATGNTEWLMDVANFAMIEFMLPKHADAHFSPTDSKASPGRMWNGERDPLTHGNTPETWVD